jgi:hypothetical protein
MGNVSKEAMGLALTALTIFVIFYVATRAIQRAKAKG